MYLILQIELTTALYIRLEYYIVRNHAAWTEDLDSFPRGALWCSEQHTHFRIRRSWVRIRAPLNFISYAAAFSKLSSLV